MNAIILVFLQDDIFPDEFRFAKILATPWISSYENPVAVFNILFMKILSLKKYCLFGNQRTAQICVS